MGLVFEHVTLGQRVLFGSGKAAEHLAAEVARLGAKRVMVMASPSGRALAEKVASGIKVILWHTEIVMHVPAETAGAARASAAEHGIDLIVSMGGGSTTGLAKAVAMTSGMPIIAVPTTYAGSEATNVWGLTEASRKTTGVDDKVLPATVIYDASLTLSLPVDLSVASGLNAMAHCVDSMWGPARRPDQPSPGRRGHPRAQPGPAADHRRPVRYPRAGSRPCTAPTCPRSRSPPPGPGCTTRSATSWAARSTCPTPRPTPSSCPTFWPSTPPPPRCRGPDRRRVRRRRRP